MGRWGIRRLSSLVAVVGLACGVVGLGVVSPAAAAPVTEDFGFTGVSEEFTVPADICKIAVTARGAAGGPGNGTTPTPGGLGGEAVATLTVTPLETLTVTAGGTGGNGTESAARGGGFHGGGAGGYTVTGDGNDGGGPDNGRSPVEGCHSHVHRIALRRASG